MSLMSLDKSIYRSIGGAVVLLANKEQATGEVTFPARNCDQVNGDELIEISGVGRLWTYTVQRFKPKYPFDDGKADSEFIPYIVGYVSFEEYGLIVEGRIVDVDPSELTIGQEMSICSTVIAKLQGNDIELYAFAPLNS